MFLSNPTKRGNVGASNISQAAADAQAAEMDAGLCIDCFDCTGCRWCVRCRGCIGCAHCRDLTNVTGKHRKRNKHGVITRNTH